MIEHVPPLDGDRIVVDLPVHRVTVLEDRAMICRRGKVVVAEGTNRLVIENVAPVLQDASLRGEVEGARVSDARVRRSIRILRRDKPAEAAEIEVELRAVARDFQRATEVRHRAEARSNVVDQMVQNGIQEIPEDASWGVVDPETWSNTFATLFDRGRELKRTAMTELHRQEDLAERAEILTSKRAALDRPEHHFTAAAEVDLVAEAAGELDLEVHYVVPNALWRPLHRAKLTGQEVEVTALAAIWQRTGEDWKDAEIVLSTARASLGTEPPPLRDDLVEAQRKAEDVVLAARQVKVDKASVGSAVPSSDVQLPGVDDGGEIQNLRPEGSTTVPSDGRPCIVEVGRFKAPAEISRVAMPELAERVFIRCVSKNTGRTPLLAGPVELVRENGTVGWTETLFVGPGASFEMGFGAEDALRVRRHVRQISEEVHHVDKWTRRVTQVHLHLSNFGDVERTVRITERIPVAEVEHVKVDLVDDRTNHEPKVDADGFVTWDLVLAPHARDVLRLGWQLAMAPGVSGL